MKGKMYSFLFYLVIFAWGVVIGRDSWRPEAIDLDDYETKSCSLVEMRCDTVVTLNILVKKK
ncbi:MAG: hypothetical protein UH850_03435 [Paludibacteraceae bacterium]|nr:hypothetical protein [Paludibacteraceae bacterium]